MLRPFASLRAACGARSSRGQKQLASLKQVFALIRLALRSSAHPQGAIGSGDQRQKTNTNTNKDSPWRVLVSSAIRYWYSAVWYSFSHPFWMRRGAQGQTDQGSCLSEPKASLHETPAGPSTAGCPQRSEGTQQVGSPFLLLTLLLAKQKKSE